MFIEIKIKIEKIRKIILKNFLLYLKSFINKIIVVIFILFILNKKFICIYFIRY